jgi:tetratricopeptide (TPR) repeat protein
MQEKREPSDGTCEMPLFPPWTQTVVILIVFLAGWTVLLRKWRRRKTGIDGFLKTYRHGDFAGALRAIEPLRKEPIAYCAFYGSIQLQLGNLDEAERSYRKGIELAEQRGSSAGSSGGQRKLAALRWEMLGQVHLERQRYEEALLCFDTGLSIWPGHGPFHRAIAETWVRRGNGPAEALQWAEMAVAEERAEPVASPLLHGTNLGEALATQAWAVAVATHERSRVDELVAEAVSAAGDLAVTSSAQVRYQSGRAYEALGDTERSAHYFAEASRIDPRGRWGRAARAMAPA